jgi:hypothetical protein
MSASDPAPQPPRATGGTTVARFTQCAICGAVYLRVTARDGTLISGHACATDQTGFSDGNL